MTRDELALAHHRFYCHAADPQCTEVDEADYDFADFVLSPVHRATCPTTYGESCDSYCGDGS